MFVCFPPKKRIIYIYISCHPQTDCFVVSQHFSVARYVGRLKQGLKPAQLYVRLTIILLSHQTTYVSSGFIKHNVVGFFYLHFVEPIYSKSFALRYWQPLIISSECSPLPTVPRDTVRSEFGDQKFKQKEKDTREYKDQKH